VVDSFFWYEFTEFAHLKGYQPFIIKKLCYHLATWFIFYLLEIFGPNSGERTPPPPPPPGDFALIRLSINVDQNLFGLN
jgi:hypothetical protein